MPGKRKLYLLDACVLIKLHELGLWQAVLAKAEVVLGAIVAGTESRYYQASDGPRHFTDARLKEWVKRGIQDRLTGTGLR